ncbi:Coiled-coil domain-containing protein 149 [Camponotus floridanus]|uniref:Coiled-coil domain-containing protein 149 n=1 Tax=Camponotus floridanus TaxID=104421 RepID=E2A489_CAMFO|nr:coiled-coil domain-containing protein 149 [Camponotus floridanus]XP_011251361.1 coiled-coil domain-containing protein 149 [Camponotus floridanus]EFN71760.1 Coiled-coil domain-containing protein 149 [Camponotus floridanus]
MENKSDDILKNSDDSEIESKEILRRKMQMKSEALLLLSQELDQCRIQRDQFKLIAEQIQERFLQLRKQMCETKESNRCYSSNDDFRTLDLLTEAREQNKCLRLQVETLRQKLADAEGDIKALRTNSNRTSVQQQEAQLAPTMHQREEMIEQLEKLNLKCSQLQTDLQIVLDEKHELEMERDAFKCKAHRLNHELSKALSASKPVDLDALINENRYLQERLQQLLEEKELTRQSLSKYKSMLDSKRTKGNIKLGVNSAAGTVMTHKQVEQLLQESSYIPPQKSVAAVTDLRCLCTALLEALNDKTLALAHQKKANKILALRICELDSAVQSPTMKLLEGYTSANVDLRCDNDLDHTTNCNIDNIEENSIITNKNSVQCSSSESQVMQQLQSIQMSLPKNLGVLVQKALNNLKDNDKQKI